MSLVDKLIWQIECHLTDDLSLQMLADRGAVSAHHMCRAFRLSTGMSVMSYVRARRRSVAADAIASQDADILSVALDTGYGSHAAFTRAFASYLGALPSTVRKAQSTASLSLVEPFEMKKDMIVTVADPKILDRGAFRVVGLSSKCSFEDISAIPALWQAFNAREAEVENPQQGASYGVSCDADEAGYFRYVAGVEAKGTSQGMDCVDIPAQQYAVFSHQGHVSDLPTTVYTVWNKYLPDAGLEAVKAPDFEVYDRRFDAQTSRGVVDI